MQAMRYHGFGGPELLRHDELDPPLAGPGEVVVNTAAAGVNAADWKLGLGVFKDFVKLPLPFIPGLEFAGRITSAGGTGFAAGDAVYGCVPFDKPGTYAERIAAPAAMLAKAPASIPLAHAAAVPLGALTAWSALFAPDQGNLQPGQSVLIHGAAGGVGTFAVQLARWRGARVVATASGVNQAYLRGLGADQTIDYGTTRFEDVTRDADVVLDLVGGELLLRSIPATRRAGVLVSTVAPPQQELLSHADRHGVRTSFAHVLRDAEVLNQITALIDAGALRVFVTSEQPLAEAAAALARNREGHTRGKAVLLIDP